MKIVTSQGHEIRVVEGAPEAPGDLATKQYVDENSGGSFDGAYSSLTGVPSTFTPAAHTQAISTVTGLQEALDGKQASGSYASSTHNHDGAYAALDHTHPGGGGVDVKSGLANVGAGLSVNVTFTTPFSSVPHVVVTSQTSNADTSCTYSAHSVTVNGFTLRGTGNPAGNVAWIATNAGNA